MLGNFSVRQLGLGPCARLGTRLGARQFSSSQVVLSQVDPNDPFEAPIKRVKRPGQLFAERMSPEIYLGQQPLYTGPISSQIAFSKRWSLGFFGIGSYIGYLVSGVVDITGPVILAGVLPLVLPLPLIQYFAGSYVSRIYRVYRKDEPQTLENLTRDETLMVEKISMFGRSSYGVPIRLQDTFVVNKRRGWVNWAYVDPKTGAMAKLYVQDNLGGLKMDRIWGILEKNSGIDNGREFLNQRDSNDP